MKDLRASPVKAYYEITGDFLVSVREGEFKQEELKRVDTCAPFEWRPVEVKVPIAKKKAHWRQD